VEALSVICDLELSELASIEPPRGFGRDWAGGPRTSYAGDQGWRQGQVGNPRACYVDKSAFDLSDMSDVMDDRTAGSMVPRCVVDLKPGVCDASLRGFGAW